ncbi:hypothetical protein J010_06241 [Cryptococcus neoformans]|nr:hypothetical protein C355_06249 [Cryptococcus neoformans var. grubii Th84]OXH01455.1 hypothetical protein J010_06241 [Cryptococcus neoformans var. grubii]OXH23727.1 hypothetical protein J009_06216 [Cryptococcus neoformans var. grubii]OXH43509.1 hypothetical protein J004_06227 [Cryptococcus neoformans var. grubii]OXH44132.1 hypothetical protein J003_06215 [Cryptococcus neoformans var. grubii]
MIPNQQQSVEQDDWEIDTQEVPKKLARQSKLANPVSYAPNTSFTTAPSSQDAGPDYGSATGLARANRGVGDVNEDEDDWFRGDRPTTNRQVWDSANSRNPSTTIIAPQALPTPTVQLLRRTPNLASSSPNSSGNGANGEKKGKSMVERAEEYRLARERIFGAATTPAAFAASSASIQSSAGPNATTSSSSTPSPSAFAKLSLNPSDKDRRQDRRSTSGNGRQRGHNPSGTNAGNNNNSNNNSNSRFGGNGGVSGNGGEWNGYYSGYTQRAESYNRFPADTPRDLSSVYTYTPTSSSSSSPSSSAARTTDRPFAGLVPSQIRTGCSPNPTNPANLTSSTYPTNPTNSMGRPTTAGGNGSYGLRGGEYSPLTDMTPGSAAGPGLGSGAQGGVLRQPLGPGVGQTGGFGIGFGGTGAGGGNERAQGYGNVFGYGGSGGLSVAAGGNHSYGGNGGNGSGNRGAGSNYSPSGFHNPRQ